MKKHLITNRLRRMAAVLVVCSSMSVNILMPVYAGAAHADVEETMYLNMDYYGKPEEVNIVKGITFNGTDSYTDHGKYNRITNMSDTQKPQESNGTVTWNRPEKGGKFYFQGAMDKEDVELPWDFDVSYYHNGMMTDADKIGGRSGLIEIRIDAIPNKNVSEYMRNNVALMILVPLDSEKCYSVDAPDSQTATIANYTGVAFECIPGKEGHFAVRVGTESFESAGVVFAMTPLTMSDLSKIKDLKEIKDTFRNDTNAMMDDFEAILDDITNVKGQLDQTNKALNELQSGKDKLHNSAGNIFASNDIALQDLRDMSGTLQPVSEDLKMAQWMVYDINANLNSLDKDLLSASSSLKALNSRLKQLGAAMGGTQISSLSDDLTATKNAVNNVYKDIHKLTKATPSELVKEYALVKDHGLTAEQTKLLREALNLQEEMGVHEEADKDTIAVILAVPGTEGIKAQGESNRKKAERLVTLAGLKKKTYAEAKAKGLSDEEAAAAVTAAVTQLCGQDPKYIPYTSISPTAEQGETAQAVYEDSKKLTQLKKTSKEIAEDAGTINDSKLLNIGDEFSSLDALSNDIHDLIDSLEDEEIDEDTKMADFVEKMSTVLNKLDSIMSVGGSTSYQAARVVNDLRDLIGDIDGLIGIMNAYYEDVQKLLSDSDNVLMQLQKTSDEAANALQQINDAIRAAEPELNAAADDAIAVGKSAVDTGNQLVDHTTQMKDSGAHLRKTINDKLDEEEADNNFLNIDPDLPKISLTSSENPEPTSITIICRTAEIKAEDLEVQEILDAEEIAAKTSVIGRLKNVFVGAWKMLTSLFKG